MDLKKRRRETRIVFLAAFLFLYSILQFPFHSFAETPPENSCVACHEDIWQDLKASIHGQQGILCNRCHGGDPTKTIKEEAKAPDTGYIGIPDKKQIIEKCGQCHADVEVMNFYGVRTDQLARYKTSQHGKKLLVDGDEKVAACADCHGAHDVVGVADPNSPVYPSNLPNTCAHCHSNKKLMVARGLASDIPDIYKESVHGKALYEKKDLSVAQCASCHGGHGAVPPGVKAIGDTCGKCHINEKKYFMESVHAKLGPDKFSECISCHGNHGVHRATTALYEEACQKCHSAASPEAKHGQRIESIVSTADHGQASVEALVKQASIDGIFVEPEMALLQEVKTNVIAMTPIQHTLSLPKLLELQKKVDRSIKDIRAGIQEKRQSLKRHKYALIFIWIFIAIMVSALWTRYNQLTHGQKNSENKH